MSNSETWALRDAMRDALHRSRPVTAPVLFSRVTDVWGHIEIRRLWNILRWLLDRGFAVRLAPRGMNKSELADDIEVGYLRSKGGELSLAERVRKCQEELAADGLCIHCGCPFEENPCRWTRKRRVCHGCLRVLRNYERKTLRAYEQQESP